MRRGPLRLLLSGPASSGARATPEEANVPGRNRIHLVLDDLDAEIDRLRAAGLAFRSEVVAGPGGRQILLADPDGNLVELFQPASRGSVTRAAAPAVHSGSLDSFHVSTAGCHLVEEGRLSDPLLAAARAAPPRTLLDVLDATIAAHPDAPAIDDTRSVLTYAELGEHVDRMARELAADGVRRGDTVGVRAPSGTHDLYVSILGIMRAGASYVPVDADDPQERAELVFGEARVTAVVGPGRAISTGARDPDAGAVNDGLPDVTQDDDAWVIFTSGSTGVPKGVAVTHRSAAAFVDAEARMFLHDEPIGPGDRVLAGLSVAFDASCEEMWLAWRHGACLVPAPRALVRTGIDLGPWLIAQGITIVSTVPTLAALWPPEALEQVRLLIFGGEACPPELAERLATPEREVWNTYGPTEATVVACGAVLDGRSTVRIGLPLDGWDLVVVDSDEQPVRPGEVGQLIIGGVGLARYLDPVKDSEKFAPCPASPGIAPTGRGPRGQ